MQWKNLLRLGPAVIVAVGLTLTVQAAAGIDTARVEEAMKTEDEAIARFASVAEEQTSAIRAESERVDALIAAVLSMETTEIEPIVSSLNAFERGPTVQAVAFRDVFGSTVVVPEGAVQASHVPGTVRGLTETTEGRWAETLTYRVFDVLRSDHSAAVVLDVDALVASRTLEPGVTLSIVNLPGQPEADPPDPAAQMHGSDVSHNVETGELQAVRDVALFGEDAKVVLTADGTYLPNTASNEMLLVVIAGVLSTLLVGAIAWYGVRVLDRMVEQRDVAAAARRAAMARFHASFTHAPMGVVEIDDYDNIVVVNPRFASKLGFLPEELVGVDLLDLIDGTDRQAAADRVQQVRRQESEGGQSERRYRTLNGTAVWMRETVSMIDAGAGTSHVLIQVEDISDERRTRAELRRKALFDELTGLPNRSNLVSQLRLAVDTAAATTEKLAVMFIDLNKFKQVNDTLGHEAGDLMLIEVADRLRNACRAGDTVARLGGDEFVVVCQGIIDSEMAHNAAGRYFGALNQPMELNGGEVEVSASVGLVVANGEVEPEELLRNADQAMYRAKSDQATSVVEFDSSMKAATVDRVSQEIALRQAVEADELELHYQPIVDGHTADVVGLEALVRWRHPRNGLTAPGEFLPLAAELGLLERIDRWAIRTGAEALAEWSTNSADAANWYLSVNTSPEHYLDPTFADWVVDVLVQAGLEPRRLVLERPEQTIYEDQALATGTIRQLRSRGVRISLDQFGVGQTTLADLASLEVDSLKIGRSFVRNATARERAVLSGVATMAGELGLEVVAEGVESQAELDLMVDAGLQYAQGFHFSRPLDGPTLARARGLDKGLDKIEPKTEV